MKILLTGANGYSGSRLLLALLHEGHEVKVIQAATFFFNGLCKKIVRK